MIEEDEVRINDGKRNQAKKEEEKKNPTNKLDSTKINIYHRFSR